MHHQAVGDPTLPPPEDTVAGAAVQLERRGVYDLHGPAGTVALCPLPARGGGAPSTVNRGCAARLHGRAGRLMALQRQLPARAPMTTPYHALGWLADALV